MNHHHHHLNDPHNHHHQQQQNTKIQIVTTSPPTKSSKTSTNNHTNPSSSSTSSSSGLEHHLIGLSPQYWSYTPLFIADIETLHLINGVANCLVIPTATTSTNPTTSTTTTNTATAPTTEINKCQTTTKPTTKAKRILPLSKCELIGIVTYIHEKSNRSTHYIVDDGTGSIDCVSWNTNDADYNNAIVFPVKYRLLPGMTNMSPSSSCVTGWEEEDGTDTGGGSEVRVGDIVRILGWMKVVTVLGGSGAAVSSSSSPNVTTVVSVNNGNSINGSANINVKTVWETRQCVREIHIHKIQRMDKDTFDCETVHWLKCLQFSRRVRTTVVVDGGGGVTEGMEERQSSGLSCDGNGGGGDSTNNTRCDDNDDDESYHFQCRLAKTPVYNGADVLKSIEPSLQSKVVSSIASSVLDDQDYVTSSNNTNSTETYNIPPSTGNGKHEKGDGGRYTSRVDDVILRAYFGRDCTCSGSSSNNNNNNNNNDNNNNNNNNSSAHTYREVLLYCHCLATGEPLDQGFRFRDALLNRLLDMEKRMMMEDITTMTTDKRVHYHEWGAETNQKKRKMVDGVEMEMETAIAPTANYQKDNNSTNETNNNISVCLQFSYQAIAQDTKLKTIANQITNSVANMRRLYTNTFQWLRNDGIIHLLDVDADLYLLLSRDQVLLPSMRSFIRREEEWKSAVDLIDRQLHYGPSSSPLSTGSSRLPPVPLLPPLLKALPFARCQVVRNIVIQELRKRG